MDDRTCYCRNPRCVLYGKRGPYASLKFRGRHRQAARYECRTCGGLVSARTGTAYAGVRTELNTYLRGATAVAEGLSIRATGRLLGVDKDTVNHWLPGLGRHCQRVMNYFFRNLPLAECQLDELWTFIAKKEAQLTPLEKLAEVYGDAWVWIAFSPVCKLVPAWVVGKRTLAHARRLVFRLTRSGPRMGRSPSSPATSCRTMPMRSWRSTASGCSQRATARAAAFPNRAACHHPICAMPWSSKNARTVGWWKSRPAWFMAPPSKSKPRCALRPSVTPLTLMAWSAIT